jgi:hypothetical protein
MNTPQAGQVYKHYKGGKYIIIGVGTNLSNGSAITVVLYRSMQADKQLYVRNLDEFCDRVEILNSYGEPEATTVRFEIQ